MIALICKEVGTPTVAMWPGLAGMPRFNALALAGTVGGKLRGATPMRVGHWQQVLPLAAGDIGASAPFAVDFV